MYLNSSAGGGFHIWRQRFPDGVPEQLTMGLTEEHGIAVAPDGRSLITSVGIRTSTLWVHDDGGARQVSTEGNVSLPGVGVAEALPHGNYFSPDRQKLYYLVRSGGGAMFLDGELWEVDLRSRRTRAILPGFKVGSFDVSADGKRVVFAAADPKGRPRIWITALDGSSPPRQLSTGDDDHPIEPRATSAAPAQRAIAFVLPFARGTTDHQPGAPDGRTLSADGDGSRPMWRIRVRAEREEPAITVLHDELARVPGRVAKGSRELDSTGGILGVQRIRVLDEQVCVEQFVRVFVGIWRGRIGEAEVDSMLVARDDGVDRRVIPGAETLEAKCVSVIREGRRQVRSEELGRDLADHRAQHTTRPDRSIETVYDAAGVAMCRRSGPTNGQSSDRRYSGRIAPRATLPSNGVASCALSPAPALAAVSCGPEVQRPSASGHGCYSP